MRVSTEANLESEVTMFDHVTFGAPAAHFYKYVCGFNMARAVSNLTIATVVDAIRFKNNLRQLNEVRTKLHQQASETTVPKSFRFPAHQLLATALVSTVTSMNAPASEGLHFASSEQLRKYVVVH
jgi:hypothetical protein